MEPAEPSGAAGAESPAGAEGRAGEAPQERSPAAGAPADSATSAEHRCAYCGKVLDLRYHFCVHCAVPFRDPDQKVYDVHPPALPSFESRLYGRGQSALNFFCVLAVGLVAMGTARGLLGKDAAGAFLVVQDVVVAILTVSYAALHRGDVAPLLVGIRWSRALLTAVPALVALLAVNKVYHGFLLEALGSGAKDTFLDEIRASLPSWLVVATICVSPAIFEEIAFRGVVQEKMTRAVGTVRGFAVTSVLFMGLHFSVLSAPYLFGLSMYLCWLRARTRSLYPAMAVHFLHNYAVLFWLYGEAPQ